MDLEKTQQTVSSESSPVENKEHISTDNIFAELSGELDFGHQDIVPEELKKDKIYYTKMGITAFSILNIVLFMFVALSYSYLKIQNNSNLYSSSFLDPFCGLFLSNDMPNTGEYCSSVSALLVDYTTKTSELKSTISKDVGDMISDAYIIENFVNTREVSFLVENKNNRMNILNILNDFDNMKNDFAGADKKMIYCPNMKVYGDGTLDVECDVNSSSWELSNGNGGGITGYTGDRNSSVIEGTSISIAASFLNYIEKNPKYNFQLLDKQKDFSSESVVGEGSYVKKTPIKFKLKYNNLKNSLSL